MEMAYIQAENLKHKRTFTKTLIVLAPFVTALMNFFAPLWFQLNSYNWWYILLYPGFLTLTCALIEQRDNGKLKYRAVASLPVSQNKVWKAKIGVAGIYSCVGNFIFLAIPSFATAPALIVVGYLMLTSVTKIDFNDMTEAIPCFIAIIAMPFMYSISEGISMGVISYVVINVITGKAKEKKISLLMYILAVLFVLKYIFL